MSKALMYNEFIYTEIDFVPVMIGVKSYYKQEPQGRNADSDWDCYGYCDIEYDVLDEDGEALSELNGNLTTAQDYAILNLIEKVMR